MRVEISNRKSIVAMRAQFVSKRRNFRKELRSEMWRALSIVEAQIIDNIRNRFTMRTGNLLNSIEPTKEVIEKNGVIIGMIGSTAIYSAIHEFGGTITPKRSRFLKFPSPENQRPDGMPKVSDTDLYPRERALIPLRRGGYMIAQKLANTSIRPLFFLKESVEIPARPYIQPAIDKHAPMIESKFDVFLTKYFNLKDVG